MLLLIALLSLPITAPVEHPEQVVRLRAALRAPAPISLRITVLGDSHTVGDRFTGHLRQRLQTRYGVGGRGFVLPGRPWRGHRQRHLKTEQRGAWRPVDVRGHTTPWRGPGGCAMASDDPQAMVVLKPSGPWAWLDVHLATGQLRVEVDGQPLRVVGPGITRLMAPAEARALTLRPQGSVEVLGVDFGAPSGITLDALGINGAQANRLLRGDAAFTAGLGQMAPDVLMLAFGTNAIYRLDAAFNMPRYQRRFAAVIARIRAAAPGAECLVLGPPDFQRRHHTAVPELAPLIEAQRRAAVAAGCAFWDARQAMGGPGSVAIWAQQGWAGKDRVHLTRSGYRALAEALLAALEVPQAEALREPPLPGAPSMRAAP